MRWINRAGTVLIGVGLVLGPPWVALVAIRAQGWPRLTPARVSAWFAQPLTPGTFAALMICIAAVVWLLLVYVILRRAWSVGTARIRRLRRRGLPTPVQMTAGSMVGVAAMTMPSVIVSHPSPVVPSTASHTDLVEPATEVTPAHAASTGIELPGGGWVPYRTAVAVTALSALIWLHRRQHYQPRNPRFARHDQDLDLQPLPETAQAITASTHTDKDGNGEGDGSPRHLEPEAILLPDLPTGLLVLYGPGAINAARGLLTTAVLSSALPGPVLTSVTVREVDLELLFGTATTGDLPAGLHLGDTHAALSETQPPGGDELGDGPNLALVLTRRPDQPAAQAGDDDMTGRALEQITVVVVGGHRSDGNRWDVAADGTVVDTGPGRPRRLCTIDRRAAADLLLLVQQTARSASPPTPRTAKAPAYPTQRQRAVAEVHLLGGCRLQVRGSTVQLRRSAGLQIVAYLAVHPDGATTTELIRAIWPGLDPNTINKRLHTTLTDLRQQLHPLAPELIIRRDERYLLNPDTIDTDVRHLRRAIRAGAGAVTLDDQLNAVQDVVDAYGGELGAGFSWPWLHPAREALRRQVIDAYLHVAAAAPAAHAVDLVRAAADVDPYNETLHQHGARILTAAGEPTAADTLLRTHQQRLITAGLRPAATNTHPAASGF